MREARLVGLSQDGKQLILALAETGEEFAVPVDDRLRAALRGDRARLGQLEIQMESALRPRDIQARIRAGESPEAVAAVAQMPMERVMAFAGPVLAERDHIANLAQRASVRRRGGADAPTRNLGAWVTERLRTRHVDPATADWDAWRRDDGRWQVRVAYFVEGEDPSEPERKDEKIALFAYDAPGRYAVPDDDEARWLVGEQAQVLAPPAQSPHQTAQQHQPGERRLTAVADIDLSVAPDHGADSYEAGFEDTISLPRRNHPGNQPVSRDAERGPRRVHSVPNPDEEPTLIDVPIEQPPALHPGVRAVERPAQPPVESAAFAPPEERAAPPSNPFTERRDVPSSPWPESRAPEQPIGPPPGSIDRGPSTSRVPEPAREERPSVQAPAERSAERPVAATPPDSVRPAEPRQAEPRQAEPRQADPRRTEPRQTEPRQAESQPADSRPAAPRPGEPAAVSSPTELRPQQTEPPRPVQPAEPAATQEQLPEEPEAAPVEEPKKKPARRANKRASVPSWDEIMFGKKAD